MKPNGHSVQLSSIASGNGLRISGLAVAGDDANRLKRMGICVGRSIDLVQSGDPMIVRSVGCQLGVSRRLADCILVQNISPSKDATASGS
jgi:Fe2+ transport system protein FeoA